MPDPKLAESPELHRTTSYVPGIGWCVMEDGEIVEVVSQEDE